MVISAMVLSAALYQQKAAADCCDFNEFAKDPLFASMHPLKVLEGWEATKGKMTEFTTATGGKAKAFWVAPEGKDKPVVIMVHEWWGLNDNIKSTAEKLNTETGYGVLAIDMYKGQVASTPADARAYMGAVQEAHGVSVAAGAVKAVKQGELYKASSIGTVGYCFGGGWSHKTAIAGGKDVDACVIYYGIPDTSPAAMSKLKAPVLMIWPTKDGWVNKEVVDGFKAAMKKAGHSLKVEAYDADHAFANPSNARYNEKAASDAWNKTLAFYRANF
jgi:carboxymethylenebutenolidase